MDKKLSRESLFRFDSQSLLDSTAKNARKKGVNLGF